MDNFDLRLLVSSVCSNCLQRCYGPVHLRKCRSCHRQILHYRPSDLSVRRRSTTAAIQHPTAGKQSATSRLATSRKYATSLTSSRFAIALSHVTALGCIIVLSSCALRRWCVYYIYLRAAPSPCAAISGVFDAFQKCQATTGNNGLKCHFEEDWSYDIMTTVCFESKSSQPNVQSVTNCAPNCMLL